MLGLVDFAVQRGLPLGIVALLAAVPAAASDCRGPERPPCQGSLLVADTAECRAEVERYVEDLRRYALCLEEARTNARRKAKAIEAELNRQGPQRGPRW